MMDVCLCRSGLFCFGDTGHACLTMWRWEPGSPEPSRTVWRPSRPTPCAAAAGRGNQEPSCSDPQSTSCAAKLFSRPEEWQAPLSSFTHSKAEESFIFYMIYLFHCFKGETIQNTNYWHGGKTKRRRQVEDKLCEEKYF